jgi:hypothetical protein
VILGNLLSPVKRDPQADYDFIVVMGLYAGWRARQGNHEAGIGDSHRQEKRIDRVGRLFKLRIDAPPSG